MTTYGTPLTPAETAEFTQAIDNLDNLDIKAQDDKRGDEIADKQGELF